MKTIRCARKLKKKKDAATKIDCASDETNKPTIVSITIFR